MTQTVKNLPAMKETWVQSLGGEDTLGRDWQLQYSCLKSHGQRNLAGYSPWGHRVRYD